MMRVLPMAVASMAAVLVTNVQVRAGMVSYNFEARLRTNVGSPFGLNPDIGDVISGSFSYDTDAPIAYEYPLYAYSEYSQSMPAVFSMVIDGTIIETSVFETLVIDSEKGDTFEIYGDKETPGIAISVGGVQQPNAAFYWDLRDSSLSAFHDTHLPTSLSLSDFDSSDVQLILGYDYLDFEITSLTPAVAEAPEPSSGILLLIGALSAGGYRLRRRRRRDV